MPSEDILEFSGAYHWLSNFHLVPVKLDGVQYPSVEHAYQAAKAKPEDRTAFRFGRPGDAKRLGRRVPGFDQQEWDRIKLSVMMELLRQKFKNPVMRQELLRTGTAQLVEGNYWNDTFWGVCRGKGENHLGRLLMEVRAELMASKAR